jgi:hypothetical protein
MTQPNLHQRLVLPPMRGPQPATTARRLIFATSLIQISIGAAVGLLMAQFAVTLVMATCRQQPQQPIQPRPSRQLGTGPFAFGVLDR